MTSDFVPLSAAPPAGSTKGRLLAAARSCLLRRGYAGTTVRELVAESGANQASINYHYGSKDALLNQALFALNVEWGELLIVALSDDPADGTGRPSSAQDRWERIIDSIAGHRPLWFVNFEAVVLAQHNEEIRVGLAARGREARTTLARVFAGLDPDDAAEDRIRAAGSFYYSLLIGTAMQWLTDPDGAPTAAEVVAASAAAPG